MVLNMLTTISMIKVGKTYGNLMVDVQTGSEKLKDRARRIIVTVTGLTYDEADALLKRAKWNVKAAIVMQKTALTLPQALRRLKKADDSVREAIGEDADPTLRDARSRRPEGRRAAAASSMTSTSGCTCRNDAGSSVVTGPRSSRSHNRRLRRSRRDEHDLPRLQDRRHPHRQRLGRHRVRISAEELGVAAARLGFERHAMRPRLERRRRLVEPDVTVGADAEHLEVDASGRGDLALVALALLLRYRRPHRSGSESARPRGSRGRRGACS